MQASILRSALQKQHLSQGNPRKGHETYKPLHPGIRVANFSNIDLPVEHLLEFDSEDSASIVKKIRKYTDLPYVYVVADEQAQRVSAVLSALKAIRSPCYPYALFIVDEADVEIDDPDLDRVCISSKSADTLHERITEYAASTILR